MKRKTELKQFLREELSTTAVIVGIIVGLATSCLLILQFPDLIVLEPQKAELTEKLLNIFKSSKLLLILSIVIILGTYIITVIFRWRNTIYIYDIQDRLEDELLKAKNHSTLLGQLVSPYLIPWDTSSMLENNAKEVCCITSKLIWAHKNIDNIIADVKNNPDKYYKYILTDMDRTGSTNKVFIEERVEKDGLQNKIMIKRLNSLNEFGALTGVDAPVLPLPSDVAIYKQTHENDNDRIFTTAVMSLFPVTSDNVEKEIEYKFKFDARIEEGQLYKKIEIWFDEIWDKLKQPK